MHSVFLGNGKHFTNLLSDAVGKDYYIGSDVRKMAINEKLLSIKPPSSVLRLPRDIDTSNLWKATEWRAWILFYSVPCLRGLIPDENVIHFSMLSTALHIILGKSITKENLSTAKVLLLRFVFVFQKKFGITHMVINIHLLLHLIKSIEYLGPAWTHTAFSFEAANKYLLELKKVHHLLPKKILKSSWSFVLCLRSATNMLHQNKLLNFARTSAEKN